MVKKTSTYTEQTNTRLTPEMVVQLVAVSFFQGRRGEYSALIRDFLTQGIARFEAGLSERDRARYDEILANVRESESLREK